MSNDICGKDKMKLLLIHFQIKISSIVISRSGLKIEKSLSLSLEQNFKLFFPIIAKHTETQYFV